MSYLDFANGVKTVPFIQRKRKMTPEDEEVVLKFKESERRLMILRAHGGHIDHLPTDEEIRNWLRTVEK